MTPAQTKRDIVATWRTREVCHAELRPVEWRALRASMAALFMTLVRRLLKRYAPEIWAGIGRNWWPAEIPKGRARPAQSWRVEARMADFAKRCADAAPHSLQWTVSELLNHAQIAVNDVVEIERRSNPPR